MKHYNRMAELLFGFRDLGNIRNPNTPILNLSSLIIPDSVVRKFNPKRFNFYIKFINGLKDPATLHKFLYTLNDAKIYNDEMQEKIAKIAKGLQLISNKDREKVIQGLKQFLDSDKYEKLFNIIENYQNEKKIKGGAITLNETTEPRPEPILDDRYKINKPLAPMKLFLEQINKVAPLLYTNPRTNIDEVVEKIDKDEAKKVEDTKELPSIDVNKLKGIYQTFQKVPRISPDRVEISMVDRGVFIGVTFAIRMIALSLIYWSLNSNLINNFQTAFIYYCIIYMIFFLFIIALVNVIFYYPVTELFTNLSLATLPNLLYYFYIHFNGYNRLILHIILLSILMLIPFILSLDKKFIEQYDVNISFDYKKKSEMYNSISNFSFVIWILTSVIALKF
jgi:hypothetical protein